MSLWDESFGEVGASLKALEKLGVNGEAFARIRKDEAVAKQVADILKRPPESEVLLALIGTVALPATESRFSAELCFRVNKTANGLPQISGLGDNFQQWFGNKTEGALESATTLRYHTLKKWARDLPQTPGEQAIIPELGGEAAAETTLAEIFQLMCGQKTGQPGHLLTNGYANIFYVRDVNGVLRAVLVFWYDGGWLVSACPVGDPDGWRDGDRVFSRNSGENSVA